MSDIHPSIGVFVDGVSSYGRGVLRGVTDYANLQRRWKLHTQLWDVSNRLDQIPPCDGVIIAGQPFAVFNWVLAHVKHVMQCSGNSDPTVAPVITVDNVAVGKAAALHLMDCKLERFAYFGGEGFRSTVDRSTGFCNALGEHGFEVIFAPELLSTDANFNLHKHQQEIMDWVRSLPKPIGILTFDDAVALTLAAACMEAGVGVPEQVAIVGVNNDSLLCESAWPPLSSVDCGWPRVGHAAALMMENLLAGRTLNEDKRLVRIPPLGVFQRQSTSVLAVENRDLADAIRFIREHACDPCSMGDVLKAVPIGRRWLERQFVKTLGRSPHDEMMRVRIDTAKRFLAHSEMPLPDIANRCGFTKMSHFHAVFKRITGDTPSVYRRRTKPETARPQLF